MSVDARPYIRAFYQKRALENPQYHRAKQIEYFAKKYAENPELAKANMKKYYRKHKSELNLQNMVRYYSKGILERTKNSKEYKHFEYLQELQSSLQTSLLEDLDDC